MSDKGYSDLPKMPRTRRAGAGAVVRVPVADDLAVERRWLWDRGWRERSCDGPWRFYRIDWSPRAYYTLRDAVALERSRQKGRRDTK